MDPGVYPVKVGAIEAAGIDPLHGRAGHRPVSEKEDDLGYTLSACGWTVAGV